MVHAPESEKAVRYIQQLDEARCAERWNDVPELCRKVEKHAPQRQCLTLTARSEAKIAAYSTQRPSTATSTASTGLSQIIPSLLTAIENESEPGQESFQATVCLGWLHYALDEPGLAVARLPKDLGAVATQLSGGAGTMSGWSKVCVVKAAYLKGSAQEKTGAVGDAVTTYSSIIPWLATTSPSAESLQFKMWSEQLLLRLCQLSDQSSSTSELVESSDALRTYRYWARFWEATAKNSGPDAANAPRYRRLAWKAYYDSLSVILRHNLPYEPETTPATQEKSHLHNQASIRLQQRIELKRVEGVYESLLIKETQFPKASETNREVEAWVDSVVGNWRLLCGPTWNNHDLGEGGKEGIARSALDILYRAATKTFHSTQILRYLFIVHASLAEFELAFKAYESYVEIITRGKDRAEKTSEPVVGIDDDSTVLRTSAEAIRLLCRFGSRAEAEKALEIGHNIEKWLEQSDHVRSTSDAGSIASTETQVESTALAVAYCAIGISQAHWARLTYEVEARAEIQAKAIQYLRRSLTPSLGDSNNLEALYALALVLAETRDIPGAIKLVKRALSPATRNKTAMSTDGVLSGGLTTEYGRERKLIPLWHLLALLLTSRSEYTAAEKACEAAFEQFGDPTILFGTEEENAYRSEHLNQATGRDTTSASIVDRMAAFEKNSILQIKMTQLALLEITEGATAAVDDCDELLALYGRLFGDPTADKPKQQPQATALAPPKSAVGTIRGSIFRGRGSVKSTPKETTPRNSSILSSETPAVGTQSGAPPAIQVTGEDGAGHANGHHHHHLFHHQKHEDSKASIGRTPSKLQKRSSASLRRASVPDVDQTPKVPPLPENVAKNSPRRLSMSSAPRKSVESGDRQLRPAAHNMSNASPPVGHSDQPLRQDVRLPSAVAHTNFIPPDPYFSKLQERRQKVSLLSSIWIFITGLYTRAQMFEDAREAITEALKLVETFEAEVSLESSSAKALADKGWGGGKSVEELWADVFAARGELLVAQSYKHQARTDFERALLHFPDHPEAIVGLSNILLDIYTEAIPLEPTTSTDFTTSTSTPFTPPSIPSIQQDTRSLSSKTQHLTSHIPSAENQLSPPELNRLAARDRAFGLLSTLTKLGPGWDYSEAWYALARAYEESGQIEKTKEVLWWCVELEDTRPLRGWACVGVGGFVL